MNQASRSGVDVAGLQIVFPEETFSGEANDRTSDGEAAEVAYREAAHRPEARSGSFVLRSQTDPNSPPPTGASPEGASSLVCDAPQRKRKWYSLYDKVYAVPNLQIAWERVQANRGAPGVDGNTVRKFEADVEVHLAALSEDLRAKTYRPQPVRRVYIPKSNGGKRPLGIPTVRDRIVQQALHQILSPIFEAKFSPRSHGFRPERGCQTALEVVDQAIKVGYEWVVDADLQAFFDTVNHERLLDAVNEEVSDGSVLLLIRRILQAGVMEPGAGEVEPTELGTPQGGPISPLLANIHLHAFDERMVQARVGLVRYADDFVLFAKSEEEATAALALAREVLEDELGLRLHPEKTRVVSVTAGFEFLGYHYYRNPKTGRLRKEVRRKSAQRFRDAIRERTPRLKGQRKPKAKHITLARLRENPRIREMIGSVNRYLKGWHGYFRAVNPEWKSPFRDFDAFVRRRLRSAIVGRTGNGWWDTRITNEWLHLLGLLSLDADLRAKNPRRGG